VAAILTAALPHTVTIASIGPLAVWPLTAYLIKTKPHVNYALRQTLEVQIHDLRSQSLSIAWGWQPID